MLSHSILDKVLGTKMDVFEDLLNSEPVRYRKPEKGDAKYIWEQIGFLEDETETFIVDTLHIWAQDNNYLQIHPENNTVYIHWVSPTNVALICKWHTFLNWFFLSCANLNIK